MTKQVNFLFKGKGQDILYDGILKQGKLEENPMGVCIQQGGEDFRFAMIDAANEFDSVSSDVEGYNCQLDRSPSLNLEANAIH